jgi:hypothetical protein
VLKAALGTLLVGSVWFGTLWSRHGWGVAMVFSFREKEDQKYEVECRQAKGEPEEASPTMSVRNTLLFQIHVQRMLCSPLCNVSSDNRADKETQEVRCATIEVS